MFVFEVILLEFDFFSNSRILKILLEGLVEGREGGVFRGNCLGQVQLTNIDW